MCLGGSSFSTCHLSFVKHPHQLATANVVWFWNSTLSLAILHVYRSWFSSVSHCFSSLLTLPHFWERGRKTKLTHDALYLSEKMPRLSVVPGDIIHQNLHCLHHRHEARAQVFLPFSNLSLPCSHPSFCVAFCAKPAATDLNVPVRGVCVSRGQCDRFRSRHAHYLWYFAMFISSSSIV